MTINSTARYICMRKSPGWLLIGSHTCKWVRIKDQWMINYSARRCQWLVLTQTTIHGHLRSCTTSKSADSLTLNLNVRLIGYKKFINIWRTREKPLLIQLSSGTWEKVIVCSLTVFLARSKRFDLDDLISTNQAFDVSNKVAASIRAARALIDSSWLRAVSIQNCSGEKIKSYQIKVF